MKIPEWNSLISPRPFWKIPWSQTATKASTNMATGSSWINSVAPGGFDYSRKWVNFKLISTINILSTFCEIVIRRMPQHLTDH